MCMCMCMVFAGSALVQDSPKREPPVPNPQEALKNVCPVLIFVRCDAFASGRSETSALRVSSENLPSRNASSMNKPLRLQLEANPKP